MTTERARLAHDVPEADRVDQLTPVDPDEREHTEIPPTPGSFVDEGDWLDQQRDVPLDEPEEQKS